MTTPYTYLIGWPIQNKWYYGVRYAKECHPSDLLITYFTSSKIVRKFIEDYGNPQVVNIRKTFNSVKSARDWEHKVLRRLKVTDKDHWLNLTHNKSFPILSGKNHHAFGKTGELSPCYGIKRPDISFMLNQKVIDGSHPWSGDNNPMKRKSLDGSHHWIGDKNPMKNEEYVTQHVAKISGVNHHMKRPEVVAKVSGSNNWIYKKEGALEERQAQFRALNAARKGIEPKKRCCKFCNKSVAVTNLKPHERACPQNPNRLPGYTKGKKQEKIPCKFCSLPQGKSALSRHEKRCPLNPLEVLRRQQESKTPTLPCTICGRIISENNLTRHEKSCRVKHFVPTEVK